jgi:hypothetical protein
VQVGNFGYPIGLRLEATDTGAAAHMSLHLIITMSKSRPKNRTHRQKTGHSRFPDNLTGGESALQCWRPEHGSVRVLSGEGASRAGV